MSEKWNSKVMFPTDSNFVNRITDVIVGPSKSSGNPMVTLKMEVVQPDEVEIGTGKYILAGIETSNYYTTQVGNGDDVDEEKTANGRKRLTELLNSLEIDTSALNWDNLGPQLQPLRGKLILTMMSPDIKPQRKNPTAAQLEAARKQGVKDMSQLGDVLKHPVTGKPLINYWPQVREIFGLAPDQTAGGKPY